MKKKITTKIFYKFNIDQDPSIELNIDLDKSQKSKKIVTFYNSKILKNKKNEQRKLF